MPNELKLFLEFYLIGAVITLLIHSIFLESYYSIEPNSKEITAWIILTTCFNPLFLLYFFLGLIYAICKAFNE